jgi:photoactive yellow protein
MAFCDEFPCFAAVAFFAASYSAKGYWRGTSHFVTPERAIRREAPMDWSFSEPALLDRLEAADDTVLETLPFGVVAMAENGTVTGYNGAESRLSGLAPANVIGRHFFTGVAPCTNNFMVAHRFETEAAIDAVIDYVFTLRMQPTAVRLRLLKQPGRRRMYLVVERK